MQMCLRALPMNIVRFRAKLNQFVRAIGILTLGSDAQNSSDGCEVLEFQGDIP